MKTKATDKYYASDYLKFDEMRRTVKYLSDKGDKRFALLIALGCFTGLRIGDLLRIKYSDLQRDCFFINEKKTNKLREIVINPELRTIITNCVPENIYDKDKTIFSNIKGEALSTQGINARLKRIKKTLNIACENFSCHSLRKGFSRQIYEDMGCTENALIYLQKILGHSSTAITIIYLGLQREIIRNLYMNLGQGVKL